jgi:acetyltransferase-like isoleucine patch superfamily enzyme
MKRPATDSAARPSGTTGAVRMYQDIVVGSRSWLRLLQHELIASWGGALPGAVGLAFRQLTWRSLFHATGRGITWGRSLTLRHAIKMCIGNHVTIDDGCQLDAQGCEPGAFTVGDGALISRGCIVSGKYGSISIGPGANIGAGCVLYASEFLEIGADSMLAALCFIGGGNYATHGPVDTPMALQPIPGRGVVIEADCWLGAGAAVIDGVRIGRGSVVAAGAVVISDVPPYSIVAGVPARVVGQRQPAAATG